ncbi:MAG: ATP-binding protein [Acidimicrobiales bacterium]
MHVQYLNNMGVRASMSISLAVDGRLWGLISAHHYTGPRHVPHAVQAVCEFVSVVTSMLLADKAELESFDYRLDLERRQNALLEHAAGATTLAAGLAADEADLLGVCGATGAAVRIGEEHHLLGRTPSREVVEGLIGALRARDDAELVVTDAAGEMLPDVALPMEVAAGLLAAPLSRLHGNYVLWFRPEWPHTVTWARSDAPVVIEEDGALRLAPRESFEKWKQEVRGRSRPWLDVEVAAVRALRSALGAFLLSWAEQLAKANAQLAAANSELDAFAYAAAHDLKEPLRAVFSHATFLAEDYGDTLDEEGRGRLDALVRLSQRMSGLLDTLMDYATIGRSELRIERFPLADLVADAADLLSSRLTETGAQLVVGDLPTVRGDRDRLTEVLTNLISNAAKYNDSGEPRIEISVRRLEDTARGLALVRLPIDAEVEPVVVCVDDNGIGVPEDKQEEIFRVFKRLHSGDAYGGGAGAGLTIARRILERHGGRIWVEPRPGKGSRFCFTLQQ